MARAAVTNSEDLSLRNSPRISREIPGQPVSPSTAIIFQMVGFSTIANRARMSTSVGMHITTSVIRLTTTSTQPPK